MFAETDQLTQLMQKKQECLGQLRTLGRTQLDLIAAGDLGELFKVLAVKQRFLQVLQALERELDPFRGQAPEQRRWRCDADRQRCQALQVRCESLMSEIVEQEKQSEQQLIRHRDDAANQLQGMHVASQAHGAYRAHGPDTPSQLDLSTDL